MVDPSDPNNTKLVKKKNSFTVAANSRETVFYDTGEDGWVTEIVVDGNSPNLILEIAFGTDVDSMKIQDAQNLMLNAPNTSFWVPNFGGSGKYVIAYQPINNPTPYKGSITVNLKNETASDISITLVTMKKIVAVAPLPVIPPIIPGQEFPSYGIIEY